MRSREINIVTNLNDNMNTFVLLTRNDNSAQCTALCLQKDYDQLLSENKITLDDEIMDEFLVKSLYPEAYAKYLMSDMAYCITIWIEKLFQGEKDYSLEDDTIFTQSFIINVVDNRIVICSYVGCDAVELANLVLLIKDRVGDLMEIEIRTTTKFCNYSAN